MDSLLYPLNFDLCSWLDFPSDAQIFAETSEDGTLMLRECVENAAESEFKCEMKEGEQGRVSFLLDGVQNLILIHAVHTGCPKKMHL